MQVKLGQTLQQVVQNESIDGITFDIFMKASAANTAVTAAQFVANQVQIKAELKRTRGQLTMLQDNLQILGIYSAKDYGNMDFLRGNTMTIGTGGAFETMLISCFVGFGGPVNLKGSDQLVINVTASPAVWGAGIDSALSYIDFYQNPTIGVEMATPFIRSLVVQAATENDKQSLGDNVTKIMMLNLDKDSISDDEQVIASLNLNSDKLSFTRNFYTLWNAQKNLFTPPATWLRYFTDVTGAPAGEAFPYLPRLPQSMIIYASPADQLVGLNNCQLNVSYRPGEVTASNNFYVWTGFIQDAPQLKLGTEMVAKHVEENLTKAVAPAGA